MAITQEIDDFTKFARQLAEQEEREITLDEAYQQWRAVDPTEVSILRERLASYDAGERGRPADEAMEDLRAKMVSKYGSR